jgi:hypothetical protein
MLFLFFYLLCFRLGLVLRNIGFLFFWFGLVRFGNLGWGFAKKALTRTVQVFRSRKFHITSRSSTAPSVLDSF